MTQFEYARAQSIPEALKLLSESCYISSVLAGGTDLMVLVRHQSTTFNRLVDITHIPELKMIERDLSSSLSVKKCHNTIVEEIVPPSRSQKRNTNDHTSCRNQPEWTV